MAQQIQNMTPVEIDTYLSEIWNKQAAIDLGMVGRAKAIKALRERVAKVLAGESVVGMRTAADGIRLIQNIEKERQALVHLREEKKDLEALALPFENEYVRRGRWNRVFLAQSSDGHAHRGQNCSTCHHGEYRTQFVWLVEYSGKPEAEIVADAGKRACTTCYPTAPIGLLAPRTKMFTPEEEKAARAREAREVERAREAIQAAEKGITTPGGGTLYAGKDNDSWDVCKTLRTAETAATDALVDLIDVQRQAGDPEFAWLFQNGRTVEKRTMEIARHAWCLIRSIAAKKGQTFEETFQVHEKKAQAKIRKQDRSK